MVSISTSTHKIHTHISPLLINKSFKILITPPLSLNHNHHSRSLRNNTPDSARTQPAKGFSEIPYPKPDNKLSFDLLTSLSRSGTSHDHDQPSHLVVKPHLKQYPSTTSITKFAGPEQRFCPAGVYEYTPDIDPATGQRALIINAQNCVHCKCCSIKTPSEYIQWTVPEGGGGPSYTLM